MTSRNRVAYLTLQATREGQAAHAHVHEVILGLRKRGWEVVLFSPDHGLSEDPSAITRVREMLRVQFRIILELRNFSALYVRAHFLALPAAIAARFLAIPVIQECNGSYEDGVAAWPSLRRIEAFVRFSHRLQYRIASRNIAVTPGLAEWLNDQAGRQDTRFLSNGANVERFRPGLPRPDTLPEQYALFFGALAPWQGIPAMLAATTESSWPAALKLVVVGDGIMRPTLEEFTSSHDSVIWMGSVPYAKMPQIVSNALVSLAVKDHAAIGDKGLSPLKVYESMAAGIPVIVADYPGVAEEVAAHACGILVRSHPVDIAVAVSELHGDPERAQSMGSRGRDLVVREHSWDGVADATSNLIREAIAGTQQPVGADRD